MSERHAFITKGIDKTTFVATGTKLTNQDPDLRYFIHEHGFVKNATLAHCDELCIVIEQGSASPVLPSENALTNAIASVE